MSEARDRPGKLAVGLLGPLDLTVDGRAVPLAAGRVPTLLAVLAMAAGGPVPVDRLSAALWGDAPPDDARRGVTNARRSVQTYLARLRAILPAGSIHTTPVGYLLRVEPDDVDALRFLRLLDAAAGGPDPDTERARLAGALALWRGSPFEGLGSDWLARTEAPRLLERYLSGLERRVDLDLQSGRHRELVPELRHLTGLHPLRESLWVRLLAALDRGERHAEALAEYQAVRVRLADELGADPGPQLRQAHADLLAGRPVLAAVAPAAPAPASVAVAAAPADAAAAAVGGGRPVPRQLPAGIDGFAGRQSALKTLTNLIDHDGDSTAATVVITAIAGTAGVGKTAIAVHWAHQVADRFPDGQLYVNLRGFHPSGRAMEPVEAIRGFLGALGVPPQHIPVDSDAQAGLYRSLLAGKRVLVLLDNARDADQVRPLLPGSPGCLAIVTSRNQLSLVAAEAARPLVLDPLPVNEALELLARRLGAGRVAAEPAATDEIITRCARLPLALAIVAGRAATQPGFPLAALASELHDARADLDPLSTGEPASDIRTAFSWSYQIVTPAAARLFRLLGLHPGPDITAPATASLIAVPMPQTRMLLAELRRAHLLTEQVPGRFSLHDLLRTYAAELVRTHDRDTERHAALHRMHDHYLRTAFDASHLLNPQREPVALPPSEPGVVPEVFDAYDRAMGWFTAEHEVLLASVDQAGGRGLDVHAYLLAWSLQAYLRLRGHWPDWAATHRAALEATQRLGDRAGQAYAHRGLGAAYARLGRHEEALVQLRRALDLYVELGDQWGQATTYLNLGAVFERQGRHAEALEPAQRGLRVFEVIGDRPGQAKAANSVGWCHAQLGNLDEAVTACQQALTLAEQIGAQDTAAYAWDSLGYAQYRFGDHRRAATSYQRALGIRREIGDRYHEATTLRHLGDVRLAQGEPDAAGAAWREALSVLDELNHPDAEQVRTKLAEQPATGS